MSRCSSSPHKSVDWDWIYLQPTSLSCLTMTTILSMINKYTFAHLHLTGHRQSTQNRIKVDRPSVSPHRQGYTRRTNHGYPTIQIGHLQSHSQCWQRLPTENGPNWFIESPWGCWWYRRRQHQRSNKYPIIIYIDDEPALAGPYQKILSHFQLDQLEQLDFDKEYWIVYIHNTKFIYVNNHTVPSLSEKKFIILHDL